MESAGEEQGYTPEQIEEYAQHIAYCKEWMRSNGVLEVAKEVTK